MLAPPSGTPTATTTSKSNVAPHAMTDFLERLPYQAEGGERIPVTKEQYADLDEIISGELESQPRLYVGL